MASAMTDSQQRVLRTVLLWLCVATELIIVASFVDVIGLGSPPWYGQAGASLKASGVPFEVVVSSVDAGEAADRAGLRVGDFIDIRANSAIERWQWFGGFPTPMVGQTTAFAVTRGTQHLRLSITTAPWNFRRYWYFWLGPAGMFFVVLMAGLIVWRAAPTRSNLTLAAALLSLATGAIGSTNNFALPWVWVYVALAILAHFVPIAAAFWVVHASTFGARVSSTWRLLAILCFCTLAVIVLCNAAQAIALDTLCLNPFSPWMGPLAVPWAICIALAIACSVLAIRSARGTERLRAIWSLTSFAVFFTVFIALYYLPSYADSYGLYAFEIAVFNLNFFTLPLLLAYVTISRRLIDIGFALNRAAVFTLVSAIVIGAFMAIEWAIGTWLTEATHLTSSSISLAIAMILGLSLRFVHHHVDRFVDGVFFRKRHEDEAALLRFAHECSYITDSETLGQRAIETVKRHTGCETVAIVYPHADIDENDPAMIALHAWGTPLDLRSVSQTALRGDYAFPMIARGALMGALVCGSKPSGESLPPDERKALAAVAHGVGITFDSLAGRNANALESLREAIAEMRDAIVQELRALSIAK
jgi:hypothetical protein